MPLAERENPLRQQQPVPECELSLADCRAEFPPRLTGNDVGGIGGLACWAPPMFQSLGPKIGAAGNDSSKGRLPEAI